MKPSSFEIVTMAQEGNEDAINIIYKRYKPIIVEKAKRAIVVANHHGIEIDDIIQEGYIGLEEAVQNYSQDEKASFYTFAMVCIDRQISNYLRKLKNGKDKILNEAIVIDETIEKLISDNTDIEHTVLGKAYNDKAIVKTRENLTTFEKQVLDLKLKECTLDEMTIILNKDKKSIYNAIQRIKNKFKRFNENDN